MRPTHYDPQTKFNSREEKNWLSDLGLSKEAAGLNKMKVGPRPDRWISEVIHKLHEEHPYLAKYSLQGKLVNSDSEKLYGVGYVEVRTPTESKLKGPAARIPFVVENGMLSPIKVFMDEEGKADLLDKDIFAEAMFSSPTALSLAERVQDPSLVGQLYPPDRTRYGFGGQNDRQDLAKQGMATKEALVPALVGMGGALGAVRGSNYAQPGVAGVVAPATAGAAGGAVGGGLGYYGGGALGSLLGAGLEHKFGLTGAQDMGEMAGRAIGTGIGAYAGSGMAARSAAEALAKRRMMAQYKQGSAEAPWLGHEAEAMLKEAGVFLTAEERRAIHKTAMSKIAEAPGSISMLDRIAHTVDRGIQQKIASTILREQLQPCFEQNGFQGLVTMALSVKKASARPTKAGGTDVVQVTRLGGGKYRIKTANEDGFEPSEDLVSVQDISSVIGDDLVGKMDEDGRVTMTTQPAIQETLEDIQVEPIKDYGIYKVQELDSGKHLIGWVITNVIDFNMNSSPLKLFNGGKTWALQEELAGVRVAMGQALPRRIPQSGDTGVFYYSGQSGRVTCTLPVTITHTENNGGEQFYAAVDLWGKPMRFTYAPQLKKIVDMGEKGYAIPDYMSFMPLHSEVRIVPDAMLFSKLASAKSPASTVEIISNQSSFSLRGQPVEKLAEKDKHFLTDDGAEFVLAVMGVSPELAREKMAHAYVYGHSEISGVRTPVTKQQRQEKIASVSASIRENCDLSEVRKDTIKIAAGMPSLAEPNSVDSLLSLNFINSDNVLLFIENLPHLEAARKDLCELYLAAQLGLPDVNPTAIIRGAEALKDTVFGLRKIKMRSMLV